MRNRWKVKVRKSVSALLLLAFTAALVTQCPAGAFAGLADDVQSAMRLLKPKATALGAPSVKGKEEVAGKAVPALYFGSTKMNNNFSVVDEVQKQVGGTATLFVRSADGFVRVATSVKTGDGSRAMGTI
jgi:hypothetical protein